MISQSILSGAWSTTAVSQRKSVDRREDCLPLSRNGSLKGVYTGDINELGRAPGSLGCTFRSAGGIISW